MSETQQETKKYPAYLAYDSRYMTVLGPLEVDVVFKHGKGYVLNDQVWIFSNKKPTDSKYPYFWYEHGKILFGKVRDSIKDAFNVSNLKDLSLVNTVYKTDPKETLYDEEAISDMNAATSIFVPIIKDEDDCLKKLIKEVIIRKKININRLKSRMDKSYSLSNMKTALMNSTKMSVPNFIIWCDLLGISFDIFVQDNGTDQTNPLKDTIHYSSMTDIYETMTEF